LTQGTTEQSATEMNDAIDFIGGAIDAAAGSDMTFVSTIVMKDSFQTGLQMMSDMVRRPAFAPEEVERQRQQMLSSLRVSVEDPAFVADAVFARLVYGFHPYGMPDGGTPRTIAAITRDDVVAFHRRYFVPNNAILAVVGDVTAEEAFKGVEGVFGDWARRDVPPGPAVKPPEPTRRIVVIDKPDAVQTEVRAGHLGVRRSHEDFLPLNLAIRILGGEGANRLHQVLRTERGLTYGAQADMHALRDLGDFEGSTSTRSEATAEALRLVVDEFSRLQREPVGQRELGEAKAYMTGSFPLTIETPNAIATQVLNVVFYGLPVEQLETFRERVNAVSPEDIQRVSRYFIRPDRLSIVLVGNAAAFARDLPRLGFDTFETIPMADLDLIANDFRRSAGGAKPPAPAKPGGRGGAVARGAAGLEPLGASGPTVVRTSFQQPPSAEPRGADSASALVDSMIAAKGGLDTLRHVGGIKAVTRAGIATPNGEIEAESTTYLAYPDRVRVETKLPNETVVQVFDGTRAWVQAGGITRDVPEQEVRELRATLRRDTLRLLLAARDGLLKARSLPDARDADGKRLRVVELSGRDFEPLVLYVDPATALVMKQSYVVGGPGQPLIEEFFSDYKPVNGVQIAFSAAVSRAGERVLERRVTDISINPPLEPALFQRPAS
jgi:zinc protease